MKKKIIIILVIVCGFSIAIFSLFPKTTQDTNQSTNQQNKDQRNDGIYVKNYQQYSQKIKQSDLISFTDTVVMYLNQDNIHGTYEAQIRENSLKATTNPDGKEVTFILDIPELKRSYKSSVGSSNGSEQNTIYTLCVDKAEAIYPDFNCKDDTNA